MCVCVCVCVCVCACLEVWSFLQRDVLRRYSLENNGINVIMGPIFDHDHDGLRDTEEKIKE